MWQCDWHRRREKRGVGAVLSVEKPRLLLLVCYVTWFCMCYCMLQDLFSHCLAWLSCLTALFLCRSNTTTSFWFDYSYSSTHLTGNKWGLCEPSTVALQPFVGFSSLQKCLVSSTAGEPEAVLIPRVTLNWEGDLPSILANHPPDSSQVELEVNCSRPPLASNINTPDVGA